MNKKRYIVNYSCFLWAKDDQSAIKKAKKFAKKMDRKKDNRFTCDSIQEFPFASLIGRKINFDK